MAVGYSGYRFVSLQDEINMDNEPELLKMLNYLNGLRRLTQ